MKNLEKLAELATALPAEYKEVAELLVERMGEVIEGIGDRPVEWRAELLKTVQGTSDRSKLPKGAAIGSMILGEDVLEQPFPVIPLRSWTSRQYWDPNPDNAKMLCNSPDGQHGYMFGECRGCQFSKFSEEENKSQCNKTVTVLAIDGKLSKVFTVNFSKSNYANGTDWLNLQKKAGVAPYKRFYNMATETSKKSKNVEVMTLAPGGSVAKELLPFLEELFKLVGDDRKVALETYYKMIEERKKNAPALEAPAGVVLLAASSESSGDVLEPAASTEASATPKYSL